VFAVGEHLRISTATAAGVALSLVAAGEWAFTDAEALELAGKILKAHRDVFGATPSRQVTLILFRRAERQTNGTPRRAAPQ